MDDRKAAETFCETFLCTERQHMFDRSWKGSTKLEESALPSAAQRSNTKGQPWPLLLPSGQPLGHSFCTQGKINVLCWETPRSRGTETGFFTERGQSRRTAYPEKHQLNALMLFLGCGFFKGQGEKEKEVLMQQISWTFFQGRSSALICSWLLVTSSESPWTWKQRAGAWSVQVGGERRNFCLHPLRPFWLH